MKTKKAKAPSRFTRGVRVSAKKGRRHGRKPGAIRAKDEVEQKLDVLTTL